MCVRVSRGKDSGLLRDFSLSYVMSPSRGRLFLFPTAEAVPVRELMVILVFNDHICFLTLGWLVGVFDVFFCACLIADC